MNERQSFYQLSPPDRKIYAVLRKGRCRLKSYEAGSLAHIVRYNMKYLKIHTLKKGWQDRDEIMLHAAFQILVDFVEQEKPDEIVDWNVDDTYKRAWREICELYKWWKTKRPARKSSLDDKRLKVPPIKFEDMPGTDHKKMVEPDKKKYAAYYKALEKHWQQEKEWHEQDQQNLHRLIEIRPYLWT